MPKIVCLKYKLYEYIYNKFYTTSILDCKPSKPICLLVPKTIRQIIYNQT